MSDEQEPGLSLEQFQINHLNGRISQLVSEYERQLTIAALRIQILQQQLVSANEQLALANEAMEAQDFKMGDFDEGSSEEPAAESNEEEEKQDEDVSGD